jgi:prevent-host-death family protein
MSTYPIKEARGQLGELGRRASLGEHVYLTDHGKRTAMIVSPEEFEDLEDSLAIAQIERDRALGIERPTVSNDEARRVLLAAAGLDEDPR